MPQTKAYAATSNRSPLTPWIVDRRDPAENDVSIDILYSGVCHSDIHTARNEWGATLYPCVPGHEIIGRVNAVGTNVTRFKAGDLVGVGCMVDSCQKCDACEEGLENYCENGFTETYNGKEQTSKATTYGGYSQHIVVDQEFVLQVRHREKDLAAVAPLLCAGITMYSPLRHWKIGAGHRVGIVGLGGLGHMGVKLAKAMGAHVTVFTTSDAKRSDATRLGADEVVISRDPSDMKAHAKTLDFIINTVAASHDLDAYLQTLKRDGVMVLVGVPEVPHPSPAVATLIFGRKSLAGSVIGGIPETQEMLDFCAEHGIVSDVEMIQIHQINEAYERMLRSDVKYRFVIDTASFN